jgi:hypothetical protein
VTWFAVSAARLLGVHDGGLSFRSAYP